MKKKKNFNSELLKFSNIFNRRRILRTVSSTFSIFQKTDKRATETHILLFHVKGTNVLSE